MRIKRGGIRKFTGEIQRSRCGRQAVAADVANNSIAGKDEARFTFSAIVAMAAMELLMTIAFMLATSKRKTRGWDSVGKLSCVSLKPD